MRVNLNCFSAPRFKKLAGNLKILTATHCTGRESLLKTTIEAHSAEPTTEVSRNVVYLYDLLDMVLPTIRHKQVIPARREGERPTY